MKKFSHTNLLFFAFLAIAVLSFVYCELNQKSARTISVSSNVNGRELPIYAVKLPESDEKSEGDSEKKGKKIALTFDAAWGNSDTNEILSILKKQDIKVTFFMTGGWVKSYPEDVKAILADGHDLGNHSENHKNMSQLSHEQKVSEIMTVHERVKELTGYEMFLFRPPYGDYDDDTILTATECHYYPIQWSVDSLDWKDYGVDSIINTVCNHKDLKSGAIILCHNGAKYTAQALEPMITKLKAQGYTFVPLSELIIRENYHMEADGTQVAD